MIEEFRDNLFERIERKWSFNKDIVSLNSLKINILRSKLRFHQALIKEMLIQFILMIQIYLLLLKI